jgi:hypothetical protein
VRLPIVLLVLLFAYRFLTTGRESLAAVCLTNLGLDTGYSEREMMHVVDLKISKVLGEEIISERRE